MDTCNATDGVHVFIPPWHTSIAAMCAAMRVEARGRKDRPDYADKRRLQPEPMANLAACLCECAVSLYYDRRWNGPYWKMQYHRQASLLPDVGECIEVRRTRRIGTGVPVKSSEAKRNYWLVQAYVDDSTLTSVLADPDQSAEVVITGQVPASTAWEQGVQTYREKRVCPASLLAFPEPCGVCACE